MSITAVGLLIAGVITLGGLLLHVLEKWIREENRADDAEKSLETIEDIDAKIKDVDIKLTNTSHDDRVQARKYRD